MKVIMKLVLAKDSDTNTISFKHLKTGEYITIKTPKPNKEGNPWSHLYLPVRSMRFAGYRLSITMTDSRTADKLYEFDKQAGKLVREAKNKKSVSNHYALEQCCPEIAEALLKKIKK